MQETLFKAFKLPVSKASERLFFSEVSEGLFMPDFI